MTGAYKDMSSAKTRRNNSWGHVLGLGIAAGLLFRLGLIAQSSGGSYGFLLIDLGFIIAFPLWSMRPYYKPLTSAVLWFAAADLMEALF